MADQKSTVMQTQTWLKTLGFYSLGIDGAWGNGSRVALEGLLNSSMQAAKPFGVTKLAWGNKFKDAEIARVKQMVANLRWPAVALQWVMGCMAFETGRSFSPAQTNSIGATGLIQFIPPTAIVYFNTAAQIQAMSSDQRKKAGIEACARLGRMTVLEQLEYVEKYFTPYAGKVNNLGDLYMSILWPAGVGKPDDFVLWSKDKSPTSYSQNAGLDMNADGTIQRVECCHRVTNLLVEGFIGNNVRNF